MLFSSFYSLVVIFTLALLKVFRERYQLFVLVAFVMAISICAMFLQPVTGHFFDTLRFDNLLNISRTITNTSNAWDSLHWSISYGYAGEPLVAVTIWLFSFFEFNGLMRGVTTALFLSIIFKLLWKTKKKYLLSDNALFLTFFCFIFSFNIYFQIEGIRNFLSFALLAWTIFNDFHKSNKSKQTYFLLFLGYVVSFLIHPAALLFILLRIALKIKNIIIRNSVLTLITFNQQLMPWILKVLSTIDFIPVIKLIINKSSAYMYDGSNFQSFSSHKEVAVVTLILLIVIADFMFLFKSGILKLDKLYLVYILLVIGMCILSFRSTQVYLRTVMLILFLSLPYFMFYFDDPYFYSRINGNEVLFRCIKYLHVISFIAIMVYWNLATYRDVIIRF